MDCQGWYMEESTRKDRSMSYSLFLVCEFDEPLIVFY